MRFLISSFLILCCGVLNSWAQDGELDIYLVHFKPDKKGKPETRYYKNSAEIRKMYEQYNAERLPMRISDKGEIEAIVSCDDIFELGLCIPTEKFDSLKLSSLLRILEEGNKSTYLGLNLKEIRPDVIRATPSRAKNSGNKNAQIASYYLYDKTYKLAFIRLDELFKRAYYQEPQYKDDECCDSVEAKKWQDKLLTTLCHIISGAKGVQLKVFKGKETENIVHLRSFGSGNYDGWSNVDDINEIEPRQYVTIYEKGLHESEPIWWLEKKHDPLVRKKFPEYTHADIAAFEKYYPYQKYQVVDHRAILEVRFDKELLSKNIDFFGNISLAATRNGKPVEVSPYMVIGESKSTYGVNNKPIKEIASHFLDLFIEANNAYRYYERSSIKRLTESNGNKERIFRDHLNLLITYLLHEKEYFEQLKQKENFIGKKIEAVKEKLKDSINQIDFQLREEILRDLETGLDNLEGDINSFHISRQAKNDLRNMALQLEGPLKLKKELEKGLTLKGSTLNVFVDNVLGLVDTSKLKLKNDEAFYRYHYQFKQEQRASGDHSQSQGQKMNKSSSIKVNNKLVEDENTDQFLRSVAICIDYMDYFNRSGSESMKAFLSLSDLTKIRFENSFETLDDSYDKLKGMNAHNLEDAYKDKHLDVMIGIKNIVHEIDYLRKRVKKFVQSEDLERLENSVEIALATLNMKKELEQLVDTTYKFSKDDRYKALKQLLNQLETPLQKAITRKKLNLELRIKIQQEIVGLREEASNNELDSLKFVQDSVNNAFLLAIKKLENSLNDLKNSKINTSSYSQDSTYISKNIDSLKFKLDSSNSAYNLVQKQLDRKFYNLKKKLDQKTVQLDSLENLSVYKANEVYEFAHLKNPDELQDEDFRKSLLIGKELELEEQLFREIFAEFKRNYSKYQKQIALAAGRELFNRMPYATIDLKAANAEPGDMLEIKVMWYNIDQDSEKADEGVALVTAIFQLKQTGWHRHYPESVMLLNRINEDLAPSALVSPSSFKPTGGISMAWTYHNDFRGEKGLGKFWRWLEPSIGINVSYADFSSANNFEVGAGPIIGFWKNLISTTAGYNFGVNGQSPFYVGIGFSFSKVLGTIDKKITNKAEYK